MQFGKTIVGAIIGAILGVGLLVAVYFLFGVDKMWMAIPVALLTGLGVRMAGATSLHASYLRGAITVVLAMGAYLGGLMITRAVANHRATTAPKPTAQAKMAQPAGAPARRSLQRNRPLRLRKRAPRRSDGTYRRTDASDAGSILHVGFHFPCRRRASSV